MSIAGSTYWGPTIFGPQSQNVTYELVGDGSVSAPSIAFQLEPDTGLYRIGTDNLGVSVGGTKRIDISTTSAKFTNPVRAPNGTDTIPSISFTNDSQTGLRLIGTSNLSIQVGSVTELNMTTNENTFQHGIVFPTARSSTGGDASSPPFSFIVGTDTNTGMYRIGADNLGLTCGGVKQVDISTSAFTLTNPLVAPNVLSSTYTPTFSSLTNCASPTILGTTKYSVNGDIVQIFLRLTIDPTTADTQWSFNMTVPVARVSGNFNNTHLAGAVGTRHVPLDVIISYVSGESVNGAQTISLFGLDSEASPPGRTVEYIVWYALTN